MSFVQKSGSYGTRGSTNGRHGITWKFLRLRPSFCFFFLYCAIFLSLLRLLTASLDSIRLFVEADDTTHEEESTNSDRNDRTEVTDLGPFFHRRFSFLLFPPLSRSLLVRGDSGYDSVRRVRVTPRDHLLTTTTTMATTKDRRRIRESL